MVILARHGAGLGRVLQHGAAAGNYQVPVSKICSAAASGTRLAGPRAVGQAAPKPSPPRALRQGMRSHWPCFFCYTSPS